MAGRAAVGGDGRSPVVRPTDGKAIRLARIFRAPVGRALVVPLDHSVASGPVAPARGLADLLGGIGPAGADAVVLHKGRLRHLPVAAAPHLALVVHLSAGTDVAPDPHRKVLTGTVEEAVAAGADAVSAHVNVGSATESEQLADLGRIAGGATRCGVPLVAMLYARGPAFDGSPDAVSPRTLAHLAAVAADLGADVVKLAWAGCPVGMAEVVASSPIPVLVAGGPRRPDEAASAAFAAEVVAAGAAGLAAGRTVFDAPDPVATVRALAAVLHAPAPSVADVGPHLTPVLPGGA